MATSLSAEKIEGMWTAFQTRPTAEHVAKTCGVSWHTAHKYIEEGNWSRRLQEIKNKAMKLMDADAAKKLAKLLALVDARIETAFDFDENGNPTPKFTIKNSKDLNDTIRLGLQLIGEPERKEVEHPHEIKIIQVKSNVRIDKLPEKN